MQWRSGTPIMIRPRCCAVETPPNAVHRRPFLQDNATTIFLPLVNGQERGAGRSFENIVDTVASQGTTLKILSRPDHLFHVASLFCGGEPEGFLPHLLLCERIITKILFQAD